MRFKSNITIDESNLNFKITTQQVEEHLQRIFDLGCEYAKVKKVTVHVYTADGSNVYKPFVITLPTYILDSGVEDDDIPPIYNMGEEEKVYQIRKAYADILNAYAFNAEDRRMFKHDRDFQRALGIGFKAAAVIADAAKPSLDKRNNLITIMIDPLRVFSDMLTAEDDTRPFRVSITRTQPITKTNYMYFITRKIGKYKNKNGGGNKSVIDSLNKRMRG